MKILLWAVDHEPASPGVVASYQGGAYVDVDVHNTGRVPVRVQRVGFEMDDGQVVALTSADVLQATITRPESIHRAIGLEELRTAVRAAGAGRRPKSVRVEASPDHVFRLRLSKNWRGFPDQDPTLTKGPTEGFIAAFY